MKALFYKILLTLFVLSLVGCGKKQFTPLDSSATIVAFGDSLTFGIGASESKDFPTILQNLAGLEVINSGISGETTTQGLERFQSVLDEYSPELIVLLEGGNDILRNQSAEITKRNLAKMIQIAQSSGIEVILIGVPEKKLFSSSAPLYGELSEQYDLVFDGEVLSELLRNAQFKSDPIHLNNSGYEKLANTVYQILQQHGAL